VADSGAQPLVYEDQGLALAVNGEIYNYRAIKEELGPDVKYKTNSDCEVILPLVGLHFLPNSPLASNSTFIWIVQEIGRRIPLLVP
jgi:asparagine synthase (glutamine-hydrolysing)